MSIRATTEALDMHLDACETCKMALRGFDFGEVPPAFCPEGAQLHVARVEAVRAVVANPTPDPDEWLFVAGIIAKVFGARP